MDYILQICTGAWETSNYTTKDIVERIRSISARIPVSSVIIGWSTDRSLYREVGSFLHGQGIRMICWLPCFSEVSGIAQPDETRDIFGRAIVTPLVQPGEDFVFCCPTSPRNIRIVESIYEAYFADCGFDGVFLDKIRGQSFVAGVPGVLSCGCERCQGAFLERGVDLPDVRRLYEDKGDAFFDMRSFPMSGAFELEEPTAKREMAPNMDKAFLDSQLEMVSQVGCERYPGIEVNYLEGTAHTDADYVRESLSAVREHAFEGAALCWNVMEAPDEHIDAVARVF